MLDIRRIRTGPDPGRAANRDLLGVLLSDPDNITGVVLRKVGVELPLELEENPE